MLLKVGCVVLVLVFLNEVHLVTPEGPTTTAATIKPTEKITTTKAGSKIITTTSTKPSTGGAKPSTGGAKPSTGTGSNATKTTNAGTVQHGSSMAIVLPLLTVTSLTMFIPRL